MPEQRTVELYPVPSEPGEGMRTRNGLRKRTPRTRRPMAVTSMSSAGERPALLEESPDALRARLSAFRDGVQRGSTVTDPEGSTRER